MVELKKLFGHDATLKFITESLMLNRLCSTYIFAGNAGIGKSLCAKHCAKLILCENLQNSKACNSCGPCLSFHDYPNSSWYSDSIFISKKTGESAVDVVRQFIIDVHKKTAFHKSVYVITNLENYSNQVQNALLKIFEEPPENAIFILCSDRPTLLLGTILSRSQIIYLPPLSNNEMSSVLNHLNIDRLKTDELIDSSEGSVSVALNLNKPSFQDLIRWVDKFLKAQPSDFLFLAEDVQRITDALDMKELPKEKTRLRLAEFFKYFEKIFLGKILKRSREHFVAWQVFNTLVEELMQARRSIEGSGHIALSIEHYMQVALTRLSQINRFLKMKEVS